MRLLRSTLLLWWSASSTTTSAFLQPSSGTVRSSLRCFVAAASSSSRGRSTRRMTTESAEATASSDHSASAPASHSATLPFVKPDRVILDPLPTVYVYDHCPFCVRVRLALGLKNVKHTALFLANDDVPTPTALVGKKIAPIFQWKASDGTNICMPESMDIIQFLDSDARFGPTQCFLPATGRTDLKEWQSSTRDLLRLLQRPRYVATGLLPEFVQLDGRHAFVSNHEMPPYSKEAWRKELGLNEKLAVYAEAMAKDPADDIEELNRKLVELDDVIHCEHHCSPGGLSYDDIDLFSRLRSITIIRGVEWPTKLRQYMNNLSELGDVPLYDEMAL